MVQPSQTLALVGSACLNPRELELLRALQAQQARIIAWQHPRIVQERFPGPDVLSALVREHLPAVELSEALGERANVEVDEAVIDWMKRLGRAPLTGAGQGFRDLYRYRHLCLWWWAELFLYHDTPLRLLVRDIEALARLMEKSRPGRLVLVAPPRALSAAARQLAPQVETYGQGAPAASRFRTDPMFVSALLKIMGRGLKTLLRRRPAPSWEGEATTGARRRVLFFSHASMWRPRTDPETGNEQWVENYFDQVPETLRAMGDAVRFVTVGPPVPFQRRGIKEQLKDMLEIPSGAPAYVPMKSYVRLTTSVKVLRASLSAWVMWRRFSRLEHLRRTLSHRGVFLGRGALESFRDTFLLQIPWAIRSYEEVKDALVVERPDVLVLYAESSGLGRAAISAAHELGIPAFAMQHGIMYPRYYSHEHAADEVGAAADGGASVPLPDKTAVFGSMARDLLVERGHYLPGRIVITGSSKFDALVRAARGYDVEAIRRRLGIGQKTPMLVLATRISAVGRVLEELVRAVEAVEGLWLVIKPHPAESPETYRRVASKVAASRVRVVGPRENLQELIVASNGLITVDSLASSEALVVGRPVLVINLPSNLGPLVERGVALGARRGESIEGSLRALLFDPEVASRLEQRRQAYLREFAFGADGGSTERIARAIRETASRGTGGR